MDCLSLSVKHLAGSKTPWLGPEHPDKSNLLYA